MKLELFPMKKKNKTPTYNFTWEQIEGMKRKTVEDTVDRVSREAFQRMMVLSLLVLRDEWGFGEKRMERFMDQLGTLVEDVSEGRLSMDDITATLEDELGLEFFWRR